MATYYSNGKPVDSSTLWGDPIMGGKINSLSGYQPGASKVDVADLRRWFDNSAYAYQNPNENQYYKPSQYNDWDSGMSFMPTVGDGRGNNGVIGFQAFQGADAAYSGNPSLVNGRPVWAYDAQGNLVNQGIMTGYEQSGPYSDFNKSLAVAIGGPLLGMGLQAAGATGAAAQGAAPSITGLGMTGTVPAGMGYGTAATGSLAGYGGLSAGAGYGATFGGSMAGLGAAGASGAGALSGAGADGVAEGGFGASGFDGAADGISLPGHELTHSAGEVGGLGSSAGGFGSALSNLFGGSGGAGGFNWGSLVGPAISAIGGAYSANAASNAADAQLQAAREAQAKLEPWYQAGGNALARLQEELGLGKNTGSANFGRSARDFGMADFQADPGYAFRQSEGEKALQRAASAQGGLGSGRFLKDAMAYNQGQASQEYSNAFNRFQTARTNRLNPLQSLAGQGQSTAQMVGDLSTQAGNAAAAGKVGSANALTNAIGQGYSMYQNSQQNDQNNQLMNYLLRRGA